MHELGIPLVADHVGGLLGLALLAFGAVGGIAHGITLGERFDTKHWRQPSGKGFLQSHRVYIAALDLMLNAKQAGQVIGFSSRTKARFGCSDATCCRRGVSDMLENPACHFMVQRSKQVAELSQISEQLRAHCFLELEKSLRPTSDMAVAATNVDWDNREMQAKMDRNRKRLDSLRVALSVHADERSPVSYALHPERRATRENRAS